MRHLTWIAKHPDRPLKGYWPLLWALLVAIPLGLTAYWQLFSVQIMIAMIAAVGLNVIVGNAGQLALSSVGFFGLGAYVYAEAVEHVGSMAAAMVVVIVVTGVVGLLIGMIAARLRGLYLAFLTLGFVIVMQEVLTNSRALTGGAVGRTVDPVPQLPGIELTGEVATYLTVVVIASIVVLVTALMLRGSFGSALDAIRSSEHMASSLGIGHWRNVSLAFAYSCVLAGVAGGVYAYSIGYLSPDPFGFDTLLLHITIIVVGGLGSVVGAVVGAVAVGLLNEGLRGHPGVSEVAYGIAILFVLLVARGGLVGVGRSIRDRMLARHGGGRARRQAEVAASRAGGDG